jgi:rhamnogalacturonan endolyase
MATLVLTIGKAPAVVTLAGLNQSYDGTPKAVSAIAVPAGLSITISYDGQAIAPTLPGSYEVEATIADPNYSGSATGTLTITITVLVRHAPSFNAGVDGSVQVLEPENVTLNGGAFISGDLRVPGTPAVRLNGNALLVGTQDSTGSASPMNHIITLNGNMAMRYVVRRVDAIDLPTVATPQASSGTRNVSLNNSS